MRHTNRIWTYVMIGIAALALALAFGINPGFLAVLLVCPLMMFFMMRGKGHDHGTAENQPTTALPRSATSSALNAPEAKTAPEHQHVH